MKNFCLIKEHAQNFITKLKSGEIKPIELAKMTSEERIKVLEGISDSKSAKEINLLFEKKVVQKNFEQSMIKWIENSTNVTTETRAALKKKVQERYSERMERVFNPKEDEAFLDALVEEKLGIRATEEEAKTIFKLSKLVNDSKRVFNKKTAFEELKAIREKNGGELSKEDLANVDRLLSNMEAVAGEKKLNSQAISKLKKYLEGENPSDEVKAKVSQIVEDAMNARATGRNTAYGVARVALDDYIGNVKLGIKNKRTIGSTVMDVAGFTKSVLSSVDNSFFGRQGLKVLTTHPTIWFKNMGKSFGIIAKGLKGEDAVAGIRAEIYGRPNSLNGLYEKMKLDVGIMEEAFPSTLPEKIPLFGRVFKASGQAFTGSAYRMRADLADLLIKKAQKNGVDMQDKANAQAWGKLINSMTGRGTIGIGRYEAPVNVLLFSPKFIKSNIDYLTAHMFDRTATTAVKVEAAKNLAKTVASIGGVLLLADKLQPGSVEWDPRSSDFGKIRIGDTRFDVTGGLGSFVTLAARILTRSTKSSTTGIVTNADDFGGKDAIELMANFTQNKTSPFARAMLDVIRGKNFAGEKVGWKDAIENPKDWAIVMGKNLLIPIPIANAVKNYQETNASMFLAATILDGLGFGANIYSFQDNWDTKDSKEMLKFKGSVSKEDFEKQNEAYNKEVNLEILRLRKDKKFMEASSEDKQKAIDKIKRDKKAKFMKKP